MEVKSNIGKLFGVLVLGGTLMGSGAEGNDLITGDEEEKICQVGLKSTDYRARPPESQTTCLDGMEEEKILEVIRDVQEKTCLTPFCGCWLG